MRPETLGGPEAPEGLDRFTAEIAEIIDVDPAGLSAENRLVDDLDFDSLAFVELGVLLMERYGSQNFMSAVSDELDVRALTVGSVFEGYAS
jgi:acyl carrier protein